MLQINLVFILSAVCLLSVCQSASLPEESVKLRNQRLGNLNRYYLTSWDHIVSGSDMELVANTEDAIGALTLTGTENVAIVVHGRDSSVNSEFGFILRTSLIQADQEMAVILVDWSIVASLGYTQAAALVPLVADDLISFIAQMETSEKLNRDQLHLIGFDLGAHIVGITSRDSNARARKITGLDPAGEKWDMYSARLRSTDAQFVEVIHTDGVGNRAFGIGEPIGTLDFFPNGGTRQPGCSNSDNECHHNRAWELFAATVDTGGHLSGFKCDTLAQMNNNRCTGLPYAVLGTTALIKLPTGIYRVNTGRTYPYAA